MVIELGSKPRIRLHSRHGFWYVSRYSTDQVLNDSAWRWCNATNLYTLKARN